MRILKFSECFPNKYEPFSGEFIYQHIINLSKNVDIKTIVPLRYVPPKVLYSVNPIKSVSNFSKWYTALKGTENIFQDKLEVIYLRYVSFPKQNFDYQDLFLFKKIFFGKLKRLIENEKIDLIYCHWFRPGILLCKKLSEHFNIPLVLDHHEDIRSFKKTFPKKYHKMFKLFELADNIIVHSELNRDVLIEEAKEQGINLPEIIKVYYGQNFSISAEPKEFDPNKLRLICVSRLAHERKRVDLLIKAVGLAMKDPDFNRKLFLIIVGDGVMRSSYEKLTEELSLTGTIKFVGGKKHDEIEKLLEDSDLFILPSNYEAFGIVFSEALAKGVPVITSKGSGGGEELASLGGCVELVTPNSEIELSKKIIELGNDQEILKTMSEEGKKIVRENFTWEKNALNTYNILKNIIRSYKRNNLVSTEC